MPAPPAELEEVGLQRRDGTWAVYGLLGVMGIGVVAVLIALLFFYRR